MINTQGLPLELSALLSNGFAEISTANKFGRAPDGMQTTVTDVWDRADAVPTQQIWLPPTTARLHAIVSTSLADSDTGGVNPQGAGCRTVEVYGLQTWASLETSEIVTLDGTTPVNTINSYVIIHRVICKTWGSSGPNVGIITITADVDGTVTAQINVSKGQTQMAVYGIGSVTTAYMTNYYASLHDARNPTQSSFVDICLHINPSPDIETNVYITKHTQGVSSFGSSYLPHRFSPYFEIVGPAIIKMQGTSSDADNDLSSGFDLYLSTIK